MTDHDIQDPADSLSSPQGDMPGSGDPQSPGFSGSMTLESIVTITCEMEHLNRLVMQNIETCGGFTDTAAYFAVVTPILDRLEAHIRSRYFAGISKDEMKLVVADWIDQEIAALRIASCVSGFNTCARKNGGSE